MKFLVDNNLSPPLARHLAAAAHDAARLKDYVLEAASDTVVLARARSDGRAAGNLGASGPSAGDLPDPDTVADEEVARRVDGY